MSERAQSPGDMSLGGGTGWLVYEVAWCPNNVAVTSSDDLASFLVARTAEDQLVALSAALAEEQFGQTGNITEDTADDPRLLRIRHFSTERLRLEAAIR